MSNNFIDSCLINISYPTNKQKDELWDVKGIIKNKSNSIFKFDTRNLSKFNQGYGKMMSLNSKADKIVFDSEDSWTIIDVEELHNYVKNHKLNIVKLEDLFTKLEWNIYLFKV
jgi:hypothetical protein